MGLGHRALPVEGGGVEEEEAGDGGGGVHLDQGVVAEVAGGGEGRLRGLFFV